MRKEQIFTNYELFDEFVLPYFEDRSEKEKQLPYAIETRLFKTYMGKNPLWGADEPGYKYLHEFCYAVAAQEKDVFYLVEMKFYKKQKMHWIVRMCYFG